MNSVFNRLSKKKVGLVILGSVVFYMIVNVLFDYFVINISKSHQGTLFQQSNNKPRVGDYVMFEFSHELLPKHIRRISKKLICVAGDQLIVTENLINCNQKEYPIKRENKTKGDRNIPQFYYQGIVPKGMAIVLGENNGSFDSRYWGFIEYDKLGTIELIF